MHKKNGRERRSESRFSFGETVYATIRPYELPALLENICLEGSGLSYVTQESLAAPIKEIIVLTPQGAINLKEDQFESSTIRLLGNHM